MFFYLWLCDGVAVNINYGGSVDYSMTEILSTFTVEISDLVVHIVFSAGFVSSQTVTFAPTVIILCKKFATLLEYIWRRGIMVNSFVYTKTIFLAERFAEATGNFYQVVSSRPYYLQL